MRQVVDFLSELHSNNNKAWFDSHKAQYLSAKKEFEAFTEQLIAGIARFDPDIAGLTLKDCTYRIYRDIRFSKDKTPYKTHMGAYICPKGKCSGYAGYYFHVEAPGSEYIGGHLLSSGLYCPQPHILKSVREDIMINGTEYESAIRLASGFTLGTDDMLKKVPNGFPKDSRYAEYFKLKHHLISRPMDDSFLMSGQLLNNTLQEFKKTCKFINILNRSVTYAIMQ